MDDVAAGARPFDHRMVVPDVQLQELRRSHETQHVSQDVLEQNDYWTKPWAIRASPRHSESRSTIMELDPSKFALSASLSFLNQLQGAYHATEYYNLQSIMTEGIKAGRDLMGNHGSSGRLHRYWGMFPPWDQRNRVTRSKSGVDQWLPVVTLYVPIVDLVRAGGKLTKSGVIMCDRPIPFHLVKEVWLGVPDSDRRKIIDQVEKILDYEREDEICVDWQRPLTPVAKTMESYRSLEGLLHLLCEMPDGPHDTMRVNYVSRLSEYCGVDWNHVDWDRYEDLCKDATDFLLIHSPPPRNARTSRDRDLRYRYCPWCLSNTP